MFRMFATIVLAAPAAPSAHAGTAECYKSWSVAAPIVRKERLATVEMLSQLAQTNISGDIVKTTLCKEKGDFVYRLVIRSPEGRLSKKTVNARAPFAR